MGGRHMWCDYIHTSKTFKHISVFKNLLVVNMDGLILGKLCILNRKSVCTWLCGGEWRVSCSIRFHLDFWGSLTDRGASLPFWLDWLADVLGIFLSLPPRSEVKCLQHCAWLFTCVLGRYRLRTSCLHKHWIISQAVIVFTLPLLKFLHLTCTNLVALKVIFLLR